eukprot:jgi/Tetstr1/454616/TSEL_041508.t1
MARASAVCRRRRPLARSVAAHLVAAALLLCHWRGIASGFFTRREPNQPAGISEQIGGGRFADRRRYPYIVSLRDPATQRHLCAGALIRPTIVLTAAHCVDDRRNANAVYRPLVATGWECGAGCSAEDRLAAREETSSTKNTVIHPQWTGSTFNGGDLALLFLDSAMTKPLLRYHPQRELQPFEPLTFLGWDHDGRVSDELKVAQLPYRPNEACQWLYQQMDGVGGDFAIRGDMMCAGGLGDKTCNGDSGGPLILAGRTHQEDVIVGILSFGAEDCLTSHTLPSVFARLSMYQDDLVAIAPPVYGDRTRAIAAVAQVPATPAPTPAPTSGRYGNFRFPYVASLRDPATQRHFCSGALISPTVVLTAARCVDGDPRVPRGKRDAVLKPAVVMGWECGDRCSAEERQLARLEFSPTLRTVPHGRWRGSAADNGDIALLFLERPMTKPVLRFLPQPERLNDQDLTFLGWELDASGRLPDGLKVAPLPYWPREACQLLYQQREGVGQGFILRDMICAGSFGDSSCSHDIGGPLVVAGETYGEDVGVGLMSFGALNCQDADIPAVFTQLAMYVGDLAGLAPPTS